MPLLKISPVQDLRRTSRIRARWEITGHDPHFRVQLDKARPLAPGRYWIRTVGGVGLDQLINPVLYFDTGNGFSEAETQTISFQPDGQGEFRAIMRLEKPLQNLRFDPSDVDFGKAFELQSLLIEPLAQRRERFAGNTPRLLINLVRLLPSSHGAGGAGRFALALLEHLPNMMEVRCAIPPHQGGLCVQFPDVDFFICTAEENEQLGQHIAWSDCYLDPLNGLRPKTINANAVVISIVLDLQHMEMPWLFSEKELDLRRRESRHAISRSDHLIAISQYERQNLAIFYGRDDVTVVHLSGFMAEAIEQRRSGAPKREAPSTMVSTKPYLIYPAVPWAHKNHEALIQAIAILKRRKILVSVILTNTSGNSLGSKRLTEIMSLFDVADVVDRKAFLPEAELHALFENATGLVFPSLYEGFGIPIVDAMKMNIPVLAARNSAAEEIGRDACAFFSNARNVLAMASDIEAFWTNETRRKGLVSCGKVRGADFQTPKMAERIAEAVNAAIAARNARKLPRRPTLEIEGPRVNDLHILILVDKPDAGIITSIPSDQTINEYIEGLAGTCHITLCVDIALTDDVSIRRRLEQANNLIVYDPTQQNGLDFAVVDFEMRYNSGRLSMVTTLTRLASELHLHVRAMYDLLNLHGKVHAARVDKALAGSKILEKPGEVEGILQFERLRRQHFTVQDVMVNRALMGGKRNGTAAFLAHYTTQSCIILVPVCEG